MRGCQIKIVRCDENRNIAITQFLKQVNQFVLCSIIQPIEWFVEQHNFCLLCQGARDEHPLLLAAGEFADLPTGQRGESDHFEAILDNFAILCP